MKRTRFTISLLAMLSSLMANAGNNYVDLGLPSGLLWATCNLGADTPEQFGNYYDWINDPVQEYWDNVWRTPTKAERDELVQYCTYSVETLNGIKGARYTGSNGQSIFFPFAGYYQAGNGPYKVGEGGQYWTITAYSETAHWILATNNATQNDDNAYYWPLSYFSFPVRPVTSDIPTEESSDILINEENFPDENFRNFLFNDPYGNDGVITKEEIQSITSLNIYNKGVSDLKGIEYFTALDSLDCSANNLTSLDVSKNTALISLRCQNNQLSSLDISNNTALRELYCCNNKIKGEEMDTLVNNLPQKEYASLLVIDLTNSSEKNVCTETQVNVAKEKGWTVYANRHYQQLEYEGADLRVMVGNIYYNLNTSDNTAKVIPHLYDMYSGDIDIPTTIKYKRVTYNVTGIGIYAFENNNISSIKIPDSVISIGKWAFYGCNGLTSIEIPDNVNYIGRGAFHGCYGLTSIILPQKLSSIEDELFRECKNLTSIIIPDSVKTIGFMAFSGCTALSSLIIPENVTKLGDYAFIECRALNSISFPSNLTSIGKYAFAGCAALSSITIPEKITSIGEYAFSYCSGLTAVTIPNSVTSIGSGAFSGCSGLTAVTIPNSVTSIGDEAFRYCRGLTAVTSLNPTPPSIGSNTFSSYSATLRVPTGSKDAYAAAINWSYFRNIEEIESSMPGDANADQAVDVADVVAIVNKILGEPGADFNETDADVNGDGKIDVDDVVAVVNIILDSGQQNAREMMLILEECGFHF